MIDEVVTAVRHEGARRLRNLLAGDELLTGPELATYDEPGLFGPASVAWRVHGDMSMLIGGLRALLLQTLHPLAMAGVADHSDYRHDPLGRLHRTGRFIGATTFGSLETAERTIETVRIIHDRVQGTAPDGRAYSANDPHLLAWVHVTEVDSFLKAYDRYGVGRLTDAERDRYVAEVAEVGHRLGAVDLPVTVAGLEAALDDFRPELQYGRQARQAIRFLLAPPVPVALRGAYGVITAGSVALLPRWARRKLWLPLAPGADSLAIRPAATVLTRGLGWMMTEQAMGRRDDHLLTSAS